MGITRLSRVFAVSFISMSLLNCACSSLAIARMFGGFPASFYESYYQHRVKSEPSSEYSERQNLYEVFHYLNHTLLFGVRFLLPISRNATNIMQGTYEHAAQLRIKRALHYVALKAAK